MILTPESQPRELLGSVEWATHEIDAKCGDRFLQDFPLLISSISRVGTSRRRLSDC